MIHIHISISISSQFDNPCLDSLVASFYHLGTRASDWKVQHADLTAYSESAIDIDDAAGSALAEERPHSAWNHLDFAGNY